MSSDQWGWITSLGQALAAVIGAVGSLILAARLRRQSEDAQARRLRALQARLSDLEREVQARHGPHADR